MCRDYEREQRQRAFEKLIDDEYARSKRPILRLAARGQERNDFTGATTALTKPAPIYRIGDAGLDVAMANWWFVPGSYKAGFAAFRKETKLSTFNARDDRIARSPTFRRAFGAQRCLVPASGWYEWIAPPGWKKGQKKTKIRFTKGDHEPIFLAGIWDRTADDFDTFALVTHEPAAGVIEHHDRAPVVLPNTSWADWLDAGYDTPLDLIPPTSAPNAYRMEYVSGPPLPA